MVVLLLEVLFDEYFLLNLKAKEKSLSLFSVHGVRTSNTSSYTWCELLIEYNFYQMDDFKTLLS